MGGRDETVTSITAVSEPRGSDSAGSDLSAPVALATCARLPVGDDDGPALVAALARRSIRAEWVVWNDPTVDWAAYRLSVIRSTWDYATAHAAFLRWVVGTPRLHNRAEVVAWNSNKIYLGDLAAAGLPTVPTQLVAPGAAISWPLEEFVLKPTVGAGSLGAGRFDPSKPDRLAAALAHGAMLHDAQLTIMVQPYLHEVDSVGETALIYFGGEFSHALTKHAMLAPGRAYTLASRDSQELFVDERMELTTPADAQRNLADRVIGYLRDRFGVPLYARVDLLPTPTGPVVIEVELTEPSLFLGYDPPSADRLAAAIADRLESG
jgi:glutathione synthase/RimK-type ligase-like ATP-grasp enzyme